MARRFAVLTLCCAALLGGCGSPESGTLDLAIIADESALYADGLDLTEPAQHIREATAIGLVARDAAGEVVPALADRWIVTEDGLSFIFRLRSGTWPDGTPLTAQSARAALREAFRGVRGTAMEQDLAPIDEVRAMAGRVIELRLSGPFPALLQLLAQPELALRPQENTGEMRLVRQGSAALLQLKPPEERGLPEDPEWRAGTRAVRIAPLAPAPALEAFYDGESEAVLGGRLGTLPMVDTGPLSRGTIRIDPAIGLFGLRVMRATGPLADQDLREAVAMAIDRPALLSSFAVAGWSPTTRVVNPGLADDPGYVSERWTDQTIEDLRAQAARRLAAWRAGQEQAEDGGGAIVLTIAPLGDGPGFDQLFAGLAAQLATVGITLELADEGEDADLALVDEVARYAAPRWFLNQFNCALRRGLCSEDVDYLVGLAVDEHDLTARAALLAEAETELASENLYIPLATPLRWSLIRGDVSGFVPNRWAFHPLPAMARIAR